MPKRLRMQDKLVISDPEEDLAKESFDNRERKERRQTKPTTEEFFRTIKSTKQ